MLQNSEIKTSSKTGRDKKREDKLWISGMKQAVTTDLAVIKRLIKKYFNQLHTHKF